MPRTRITPNKAKLYGMAEGQQGLFTAKQAKACGYADNTHPYHVRAGNWLREHRGIYRLAQFPVSEEEQLVLWSLWSADRRGRPQGVYSHATALAIHEMSDAMPERLHMTVPTTFRRSRPPPKVLVIHRAGLAGADVERRRGYAVTAPMRTLLDMAAQEATPDELLEQAARDAVTKGFVSQALLRNAAGPAADRLRRAAGLPGASR
jgi:predicted transcriptional regulator of viral defense system